MGIYLNRVAARGAKKGPKGAKRTPASAEFTSQKDQGPRWSAARASAEAGGWGNRVNGECNQIENRTEHHFECTLPGGMGGEGCVGERVETTGRGKKKRRRAVRQGWRVAKYGPASFRHRNER